ncbi:Bacterial Cytochrome Ubiquinol Oxidase [Symmachiella dynata]|uniref:cytochrome c n=1 Tax=Symmachiella dynata TaxID=2527995 RepID=UPI0011881502|nr:cytochrome ubiquinol oxidase subunit I [Symmachiella dynata]QDT50011.1 Bacterial Cytochrome Ubiquinol Oxidase [Symmachiella dynata]
MDFPYYPINDFGPAMKGLVIGSLGIFHVFLAQFAIGGGMLMCYFQWLSQTGRCAPARQFVDGFFRFLVLVSFIMGAVTGVGMWFTSIQISPRTIGMMVDEFHWIWAVEWTFFCLEIVAGYCFYRYGTRLDDSARMTLLVLYAVAAWGSLFWINGILSWQLTPGIWLETHTIQDGFFNPSFWPSLLYRTLVSMAIAALVACVVINVMPGLDRSTRSVLINRAAHFLLPMIFMPVLGVWYLMSWPEDSRAWVTGGSPAMSMFLAIGVGSSLLVGAYATIGIWWGKLYINGATATLLCALAMAATAGGEFVREGARKPYTVREVLYSNSILPSEVARLRQSGSVTNDPFPLQNAADYPTQQLQLGAKVFRFQCSICHTMRGVNGLVELTGHWSDDQRRLMIAQLQHTKPFMPPFSGSAVELESLVQLIGWETAGRPKGATEASLDPEILERIQTWLDEAGTAQGSRNPQK